MTNIEYEAYQAVKDIARRYTRTDWENVRIKAAIAAMQGLLASGIDSEHTEDHIVWKAAKYADMLVDQLKSKDS